MRNEMKLNDDWWFHLGEIGSPVKTVKKSWGNRVGLTAPLKGEDGEQITIGQGGKHFLNLISQGDLKRGLRMLAGTDMDSELTEEWGRITIPSRLVSGCSLCGCAGIVDEWFQTGKYRILPKNIFLGCLTGRKSDFVEV